MLYQGKATITVNVRFDVHTSDFDQLQESVQQLVNETLRGNGVTLTVESGADVELIDWNLVD